MYKVVITTQDGRTIYCKAKNTRTIIFAQLPYSFIVKHNDHPFLGQFYYGEKGINPYSEAYVRIQQLEKQYLLSSVPKLLGAKVEYFPMDGRSKKAKELPYFHLDMCI
mgnify:FL=1|jgi:hypothetical protein